MAEMLALINGTILAVIAALHFYWMLGGLRGLDKVLPSKPGGERVRTPGPFVCLLLAAGLSGFALYYFSLGLHVRLGLPFGAERWGIWVLAGIFTLRAVGDFRYVGFFKKVKNTTFGRMDTRWYSPLCGWLSLTSIYVASG